MEWHADLFYFRAKSSEGGHGVTHRGIGTRIRLRQTERLVQNPDTQTLCARAEIAGVAIDFAMSLTAVEPVRAGDDFEQERIVGDRPRQRPDMIK